MNQNVRNMFQTNFVPNSRIVFDVPMGHSLRKGSVILKGSISVSGGTTSGKAFPGAGPFALIERIRVTATPAPGSPVCRGRILDSGVTELLRYGIHREGGKSLMDQSDSMLDAGAAGSYRVSVEVPIYFAAADALSPHFQVLCFDGDDHSKLQVEVFTGALDSIFAGNDREVDYSRLQFRWLDNRIDLPGGGGVVQGGARGGHLSSL